MFWPYRLNGGSRSLFRVTAQLQVVRACCACLLLGLAAAQGACSVTPAYRQPAVAAPVSWQNAPDGVSADWPAADWWHSFGSAQLDDYIARAQSGNDDIAAAIARVRQADAQARIAGAALLPELDAGASASRQRQLIATGGPPITYNEYSPQLTASYELDFAPNKKPGDARDNFLRWLTAIDAQLEKDHMRRALNLKDLQAAHDHGQPTIVQSVEGAMFIEGRLERVEEVYKRGVRHLQLLHQQDDRSRRWAT